MLLCILSTASLLVSQTATTALRGIIKDPSGALVPGATVTITNNANGQSLSATADASGLYQFPQIAPAKYTIVVDAPGFGKQTKTAELLVNQPATIDFALSVESSTVTVDVSASAQTLNDTDASLGNSVNNQMIEAIPTETRNVPDLLALQPGVLYLPQQNLGANDPRTGAVNGGRSDQGNVTIDGIDDNDQVNGYAFTGVLRQTQDSVEEFRVVTGNSNADQGRSSGAQVSMITKTGTNKYHGALYEYHRPTFTVANDWFIKQAQITSGLPNIPGKLIRNIFGGDFGGPIMKDKLFIFVNYEGKRQAENASVIQTVPTAAYQQGNITYTDTSGGTSVYTPSDIAALDAGCKVCNSADYPAPPGPNPNALAVFQSMPAANGNIYGDGLNEGSYSFSSPNPQDTNTYIARVDYQPSDKQRVFVRGQLQKDTVSNPEQFPGQGPTDVLSSNNKGLIVGDTWSISSRLINDIRYGYIRQGISDRGQGKGDYVDFRFLTPATAETRSSINSVPVNNIVDNLSWTKGNHTLGFGANWRLIHQNYSSDSISYSGASTNPYWLASNTAPGQGPVNSSFIGGYNIAFANLVGTVASRTNAYNYKIDSPTSGSLLPDGALINRNFKANEYEGYIQDAWRIRPNLTVTYGVRYTILQTPSETHGQEITPTVDMHAWAVKRESAAQAGQIYEPDLTFSPAGPYYNKPGYWPHDKKDFAPRLAIAYAPDSKTSIRAGFGIYYDHFGEALVNDVDRHGSFGLSSSITRPSAGLYSIEGDCATGCNNPGAPRFTGRNNLPNISFPPAATTATFPYLYPQNSFAIESGLDNRLRTPYSETFDLSVQREIPGGFTVEAAYVGRLGRRLLNSIDFAEPVDYVDPAGGGDYFAAGTALSKASDQNDGDPSATVAAIPYFEHVFPFMANFDYAGESATQAIYTNEWAPARYSLGATTSLSDIDFYSPQYGPYPNPPNWQPHFWQDQFSTLYVLANVGSSYYNAGQLTLRHPMTHGLQMDFSYTYSNSIDMGSDAERATLRNGGTFSFILNTWKPQLNRGASDFDTRHLITTDYLYQLPFGRGKMIAGSANGFADAFIGGWQLSGDVHWSSGLPFSFYEPGWDTNWEIESFAVQTAPIKMHRHFDKDGNPQFFDNPSSLDGDNAVRGTPLRLPYPGEAGQRNTFRGDGYYGWDSGLTKSWKIRELGQLRFSWEVYNVTNSTRFDPASISTGLLLGENIGVASNVLTVPRRMQFALRYDF